jgi:hypothetical protein
MQDSRTCESPSSIVSPGSKDSLTPYPLFLRGKRSTARQSRHLWADLKAQADWTMSICMQVLSHPGFILSIGDMSNDVRRVIELHGFDEKGSFGILADIGSKSVSDQSFDPVSCASFNRYIGVYQTVSSVALEPLPFRHRPRLSSSSIS